MKINRKHIIIAGVPRAGKSTLCSKLANSLQYQHLTMDTVVKALEFTFPQTGITHTDCWDFLPTSKQLANFVSYLATCSQYNKYDYRLALDLYHITPQDYIENIDSKHCNIYFLGYPNITLEEKFQQIRKFDTIYDWTNSRDDNDVKEHIQDYLEISKWLQEECKKYNLPFIDVSYKREEVLEYLANEITNGCN